MKNNPNLILIVFLLSVIACGFAESDSSQNYTTPSKTISSPSPQNTAANTSVQPKSKTAKSASVIKENAELRQSPSGKVLRTVPVAARVEVIGQKGAWFYVAYESAKGWMHNDTIRFDKPNKSLRRRTPKPDPKTGNDDKPATVERVNPRRATAKCRDGTLSYSRNRRGTCSHRGGVAVWY